MTRTLLTLLTSALITSALGAAPVITSVSPNHGPATGGTSVTIKGSGFETCPICSPPTPPSVNFGENEALSTTLVDSNTIVAVTPPMLPLTVAVNVEQWDGKATMPNAFTFTDAEGYTSILMPIFTPPLSGAFGSEFVTEIVAANRTDTPVSIIGIDESCFITSPPSPGPLVPRVVPAGIGNTMDISPNCSNWPARLLYLRPADLQKVSFNLRVHDTARNASSHGTEIPAVRLSDFSTSPIVLPGVPNDPRFRVTLRVYALAPGMAGVRVNGLDLGPLAVVGGENTFEPAYAAMSIPLELNTVPRPETLTVAITPYAHFPVPSSPVPVTTPIWAFITVTNNETQEITTITPDL
jgi:hypothetical protein